MRVATNRERLIEANPRPCLPMRGIPLSLSLLTAPCLRAGESGPSALTYAKYGIGGFVSQFTTNLPLMTCLRRVFPYWLT